jgi:hypothetical protein
MGHVRTVYGQRTGIPQTVSQNIHFNVPWHLLQAGLLHVPEHAEVAFNFTDLTCCQDELWFFTFTNDAHILFDQRDSIKLHGRHNLIAILGQVELYSHSQITICADGLVGVDHETILVINLAVLDPTNVYYAGRVYVVT